MMELNNLFNELPANSRVWVYQSNRAFSAAETQAVSHEIREFVNQWTAHKLKVAASGALLFNRFVILVADEKEVGVSGCSIDSSVHFIKGLSSRYGVDFFDRFNVAYVDGDQVESVGKSGFETLLNKGRITPNTIIFNNLVETLQDLRTNWMVPFAQSWHSRIFQPIQPI